MDSFDDLRYSSGMATRSTATMRITIATLPATAAT